MLNQSILAALALLTASVAAQFNLTGFNYGAISLTERAQWCQGQVNTCGTLCDGDVNTNSCNSTDLSWDCTCASNSSTPGLQYYMTTVDYYECEADFATCNAANVGDKAAQDKCAEEEKGCGSLDPANYTAAATTSSATKTSTATSTASAASGSASSTSTSKAAAATLAAMRNYGTGAFAVGVGAAFGYML